MSPPATPRGLLFGTAAESYERYRLGYPDEVVDRTLYYAARPVATAVEVGAGTGKATRAFASRGIHVTALEPDAGMFAVLERETIGMPVKPVPASLEEYDGPAADLVYAAAAFHWTDPATRWTRTARLLVDGGVVAVFGSPMRVADAGVQDAVAEVVRPTIDDLALQPHAVGSPDRGTWPEDELGASELFTDVETRHLARQVRVPRKEYLGYLSTLSAFLQLSPADRQDVLRRVADVVPAQVALDLTVRLHLGRRA
jgi:trans-aconitate methyltransferase